MNDESGAWPVEGSHNDCALSGTKGAPNGQVSRDHGIVVAVAAHRLDKHGSVPTAPKPQVPCFFISQSHRHQGGRALAEDIVAGLDGASVNAAADGYRAKD